jgi:hypothetical protein
MLPKAYSTRFRIDLPNAAWAEYEVYFPESGEICFSLVEGSPAIYSALRDPLDFYGDFPATSDDVDLDLPAFKVFNLVMNEAKKWLETIKPPQVSIAFYSVRRISLYQRLFQRLLRNRPYQIVEYDNRLTAYRLPDAA